LYGPLSFGLQTYGPIGFLFESASGAQHPVDGQSAVVLQRHCWLVVSPTWRQAPLPLKPGTIEQHPFAGGQSLLNVHVAAQLLFPVPSSTQTAFALQHVVLHIGWPPGHDDPLSCPESGDMLASCSAPPSEPPDEDDDEHATAPTMVMTSSAPKRCMVPSCTLLHV